MQKKVHIIGAGLAGSEASWQLASRGHKVVLYEMRGKVKTFAHQSDDFAELVCSNSFRSDDYSNSAVGVLHEEMRRAGSLIMKSAEKNKLPAGGALAVDRENFAKYITEKITNHPLIEIKRGEIEKIPDEELVLIATGPLTSEKLTNDILDKTNSESLHFFDAIAPIVHFDSINMDKAWYQSRYDKGDGKDYINCPMEEQEYNDFVNELVNAKYTEFKDWEKNTPYFEGCLPIEVMANRGKETLRYGPMKPVGLTSPHTGKGAYAVVQLRRDNSSGSLWNIVGFQTKMKYADQVRVLKTIGGLENAEFARLGGIHRNTFINSPRLLNNTMGLKNHPNIRFAGQITGVEGYVESSAMGLLAGRFIASEISGMELEIPPLETAMGSLLNHITGGAVADTFQPMNINFGLMPDVPIQITTNGKKRKLKGKERKEFQANRALNACDDWLKNCKIANIA
ncbi:MAG: methylenetetrahydrofolate--tRNA-(uracil(54)-C(5))-methyltransferase (FADH(2)-oxidizing) TrmFO [Alphaproteobacteria bacterium]|nr:methylenetetrahydrofolate--tRNA-(uracil(54)-C(5))-methyltransferase (FADH(2)-oxidizing) TrmFO [Alphaproteobacteria bacterium]